MNFANTLMVNLLCPYFATGDERIANKVYAIAGTQEAAAVSIPLDPSSNIRTPRDLRVPLTRVLITTLDPSTFH